MFIVYITIIIRLTGFGVASSFKEINDTHIDEVELFVREHMMDYLVRQTSEKLNESTKCVITDDDDVLVDKCQMIEHFGKLYASHPSNFRFQLGDRILIHQLVKHVKKIVDGDEENKGLKVFKRKQNKKPYQLAKQSAAQPFTNNISCDKLKSDLIRRVCLQLHKANVDLGNAVHGDFVEVQIKNGANPIGYVRCIICAMQKKNKNKPKLVHYSANSKWPCWVLSNFSKHLKNEHKLVIASEIQVSGDGEPEENAQHSIIETISINDTMLPSDDSSSKPIYSEERTENLLYSQLSSQITNTFTAVLSNSDLQEEMKFNMNRNEHTLTVAKIPPDGNCLFTSLMHQLGQDKIGSLSLKCAVKQMRERIVAHILTPEIFPMYENHLRTRVYSMKRKEEITDMQSECKLFVRLYLSKNGSWGGAETIKAISELEEVNVIIFNENGPCYMLADAHRYYNRSICIAFRLAHDNDGNILKDNIGQPIYNHYDSVCDMNSDVLYNVANAIEAKK